MWEFALSTRHSFVAALLLAALIGSAPQAQLVAADLRADSAASADAAAGAHYQRQLAGAAGRWASSTAERAASADLAAWGQVSASLAGSDGSAAVDRVQAAWAMDLPGLLDDSGGEGADPSRATQADSVAGGAPVDDTAGTGSTEADGGSDDTAASADALDPLLVAPGGKVTAAGSDQPRWTPPRIPMLVDNDKFLSEALPKATARQAPKAAPKLRRVANANMKPDRHFSYRHTFYTLVPNNPRAVVMVVHGCASGAHNWFPQSPACMECRGLPEQMSHVRQALALGYAVLAPSSFDQDTGCWSYSEDARDVGSLATEWLQQEKLDQLPLYGLGVSSGASFVLKIAARFLTFDGLMSEALGVDPSVWGVTEMDEPYPPTLFISMEKDTDTRAKIVADFNLLKRRSSPVSIVKVYPRQVYPTYFSDRQPGYISRKLSIKIMRGLITIGMIDKQGNVLENPRYTPRPWLTQLQRHVPELEGATEKSDDGRTVPQWPDSAVDMNARAVWSLMNLAYAEHEICSDYATAAFLWFENRGRSSIRPLLKRHTYGLPPAKKRSILEEIAEEAIATADASSSLLEAVQDAEAALTAHAAAAAATVPPGPLASGDAAMSTLAGVVVVFMVAGMAWLAIQRRRGAASLQATMQAVHHPSLAGHLVAGATARLSLIPGVKERFELSEVLEQTGSPFSARRRIKTVFHADSPHKHNGM